MGSYRIFVVSALAGLLLPGLVNGETRLEEIIVTAQKREQSIQDVAVSITAFSGAELTSLKIDTVLDLGAQTPGLNVKEQFSQEAPVFTIRGVGTNDASQVQSPTVSVYVDEVLIPYNTMMGVQLFDMERIEVLKGPQGTLYGRNNTGGAVNFVTRKPTHEPSGFARIDYGSFRTFEFEGAVGGGITEDLAGRVALNVRQRFKGHQRNRLNPTADPVGEQDRVEARALLNWTPAENWDVLVRLSGGRHDDDNLDFVHSGTQDPAFAFGAPPSVLCGPALTGRRAEGPCTDFFGYFDPDDDLYTGDYNNEIVDILNISEGKNVSKFSSWGTGVTINWTLPRFTISSITGYEHFSRTTVEDADQGPLLALESGLFDNIWAVSQQIRVTGDESWPLEWIAGLYYYTDNAKGQVVFLSRDSLASNFIHDYDQTVDAIAGFAHFGWPFADQWKLTGGIRVTHETREMTQTMDDLNPFGISLFSQPLSFLTAIGVIPPPPIGVPPVFGTTRLVDVVGREIDITDVSGEIGLEWTPTDDLLIFGKFTKGFKSGGFNSLAAFTPADAEPFDEEVVFAWEAGLKASLLDGSLAFSGAAYYMDWQDFQSQLAKAQNLFPIDNAGDAEIWGFEANVDWRPPMVDGLALRFGLSHLDTEVTESNPDLLFSLEGNRLHDAPEWTFNGVFSYTWPLFGMNAAVQTDFSWQDQIFFGVQNTPPIQQSAYWLVNARISLLSQDDRWEVAVWGRNLLETKYLGENFNFTETNGTGLGIAGFPREAGLSVSYRW